MHSWGSAYNIRLGIVTERSVYIFQCTQSRFEKRITIFFELTEADEGVYLFN